MRKFTVRRGKYAGEHTIYDSLKEAVADGKSNVKTPWYGPDVEIGDWCLSDDGYVVQCLHKFKLINKQHRSGQYTDTFRFPNGTFYVYYDKKGNRHIKNFYAVAAKNNKSSLGNSSALGRFMTIKKKHFVTLVAGGVDPYTAYIKAYNKHTASPNGIWIQVNKLLNDTLVREALVEELKPFMEKVEIKIREATGHKTIIDFMVDQLTTLMIDMKLPAKEKRANIKLMLELFGEPLGIVKDKSLKQSRKDLIEAEYEILKPPELAT